MREAAEISVIMPVHNAAKWLRRAVNSAVEQPEVKELIVVEDGSTDNSLQICHELVREHPDVIKLYQHDDGKNHGVAETRNLGLKMASGRYLAFLDADDYYLPERFRETMELFGRQSDLDGTYGSIDFDFETEEIRRQCENTKDFVVHNRIGPPPEKLMEDLLPGGKRWVHLNTITIKRELFDRCGCFSTTLKQGEDTLLFWKFAAAGNLAGLSMERPVAVRGVDKDNYAYSFERTRVHNYWHLFLVPEFYRWGKKLPRVRQNKHLLIKFHRWAIERYVQHRYGKKWKLPYALLLIWNLKFLPLKFVYGEIRRVYSLPKKR